MVKKMTKCVETMKKCVERMTKCVERMTKCVAYINFNTDAGLHAVIDELCLYIQESSSLVDSYL